MICAECGTKDVESESCSQCGKSPLLDGRYRLHEVLGQGAFGTTWRGERAEDGHAVCLKELLYQRLASFEPEKMFQREVAVLRQIDLTGVPAYIDDFTVATGRAVSLFLVQELVDGETLAQEMDSRRYRVDEVLDVLGDLLKILHELHSLSPPVVHRDIKPANVMRRRDGQLVLIDFGAVKDVLQQTQSGGPSVAGTIGFMAPEQLQGRSEPATDLFGAGALAVALLSRRDPADLLDVDGRLDWKPHVAVSPEVEDFLAQLLHASIEGRPASAEAALEALRRLREEPEPEPAPLRAVPEPRPALGIPPTPPVADTSGTSGLVTAVMFGGAAVTAVVVGTLVLSQGSESSRASSPPSYVVPQEILDLRLGMTLAEAKATSSEVAAGRQGVLPLKTADLMARNEDNSPALEGPQWSFYTTIAGQPASCRLDFAVGEALSRIGCTFEPFQTVEAFDTATKNIKQQLGQRYGLPMAGICEVPDGEEVVIGVKSTVDCPWTGSEASLVLEGEFEDMQMFESEETMPVLGRTSRLRLSLSSGEHARRVAAVRQRESEEEQRRLDAIRSSREAKEAAERRRIEAADSRGL